MLDGDTLETLPLLRTVRTSTCWARRTSTIQMGQPGRILSISLLIHRRHPEGEERRELLCRRVEGTATSDLPLYGPDALVRYVLEINAGSARAMGIEPGMQVSITGP